MPNAISRIGRETRGPYTNNRKEYNMKKTAAIILAALLAVSLTACAKTTETKSQYQVTVFADSALEAAITEIAQAYTNIEDNANANEQSEILLKFDTTDALKPAIQDGAYCDIFIPLGQDTMEGLDVASASVLVVTGPAADGSEAPAYPASIMSASDRQEAAQGFLDYLHSAKAAEIFANYGFTVG